LIKYKIIIKSSAKKDINKITNYIIKNFKSNRIAEKLISEIRDKMLILQEYPNAYQTLFNYKYTDRKYKRVVVDNYSIIYYILEEQKKVVIVHIYYNKRNFFNS